MTKRIVFVLPDFFAGGAQRVLLTLAAGLDRKQFDTSVIVLNGQGPWREKFTADLSVTDLKRRRVRMALPALIRALRVARPDAVVSTMSYLNFAVLAARPWLARGTRIYVREANTPWSSAKGLARLPARFGYAQLYPGATRVISPSRLIAEELSRDFGVPRDQIAVLRNPVDAQALRDAAVQPRRRDGEGPCFVAVGRLSRQKSYDRLVETMTRHETKGHVTIFGEGTERGMLESMIAEAGLGNRITLAGFDANPSLWVAGADALLLPSRWEGLPNVALEALGLGTPVIAAPEAGAIDEIASLAGEGAVTLAAMGGPFAAAMARAPLNAPPRLRPSLLPQEFNPEAVHANFQKILEGDDQSLRLCRHTI